MQNRNRVSLLRCASYQADLSEALRTLLQPLGGLGAFIHSGQNVIIKPNLLTDKPPEAAVTTHPEVVRAIVRAVRAVGATPAVADSPSSASKLQRVWTTTGILRMCEEENVPLLNLEKAGSEEVESDGFRFRVARPILEADAILNVPKVKTHSLTTLTAAVKNMFGIVPGYHKTQLHGAFPTPREFGRLLAAIQARVPPTLTVADAIVGMQGPGPSAGTPANLGFLAASPDDVALDLMLCRILGIPPRSVPYLPPSVPRRPGAETAPTEAYGDPPEACTPARFSVPNTFTLRLIPRPLFKLIAPLVWFRPRVGAACIQCGRCVEACPESALSRKPGELPVLNAAACIGCCCCHEVCPVHAIHMEPSPLLKLMSRDKVR